MAEQLTGRWWKQGVAGAPGRIEQRTLGKVDILFNNAGIILFGTLEEHSDEVWQQILGVNLTGHFLCCRRVVSEMKKLGRGKIINNGSFVLELLGDIVIVDKTGKSIFDPTKDRVFPKEVITNDESFVILAVVSLDPANAPPDPTKPPDATKAKTK